MTTFVDTSALFALLDEGDASHQAAATWLTGPGRDPSEVLVSHNYVLIETSALVDRRLGRDAVRVFFEAFVPMLSVVLVDGATHDLAVAAFLRSSRGESLVDWTSFTIMQHHGVDTAFAFDEDFSRRGFSVVP